MERRFYNLRSLVHRLKRRCDRSRASYAVAEKAIKSAEEKGVFDRLVLIIRKAN